MIFLCCFSIYIMCIVSKNNILLSNVFEIFISLIQYTIFGCSCVLCLVGEYIYYKYIIYYILYYILLLWNGLYGGALNLVERELIFDYVSTTTTTNSLKQQMDGNYFPKTYQQLCYFNWLFRDSFWKDIFLLVSFLLLSFLDSWYMVLKLYHPQK